MFGVRNAARKHLGRGNEGDFLAWLRTFLDEHVDFVKRYLIPVFVTYAELVADEVAAETGYSAPEEDIRTYVEGYTDSTARRGIKHTRGEMERALLKASGGDSDPLTIVEERLDHMRDVRAGKVAEKESVGLNNGTARHLYIAAGVVSLRWMTFGDSCPYCQHMNGRRVGIQDLFIAAGSTLHPDGADAPFVPSFNVRYPPLHKGCDCMVVAGW